MKLQKVTSISEAIENFGKSNALNPHMEEAAQEFNDKVLKDKIKNDTFQGDEFLPETNTGFISVMPIDYSDAAKRTAVWRDKANKYMEEKTKAALEMSGADIETDRYSHMSKDDAKFNHPKYEHDEPVKIKEGKESSGKPLKESIEDMTPVYSGDGWKIYKADTWDEAVELGSGTQIGISQSDGNEYFDKYKGEGVRCFYFLIPDADGGTWCYLYYGGTPENLNDNTCLFIDSLGYGHTVDDLGYGDIDQIPEDVVRQLPGMQDYEATEVYVIGTNMYDDELDEGYKPGADGSRKIGLDEYKPCDEAAGTWKRIKESKKFKELDSLVEKLYPEGITGNQLDGLLYKENKFICEELGIKGTRTHRKACRS